MHKRSASFYCAGDEMSNMDKNSLTPSPCSSAFSSSRESTPETVVVQTEQKVVQLVNKVYVRGKGKTKVHVQNNNKFGEMSSQSADNAATASQQRSSEADEDSSDADNNKMTKVLENFKHNDERNWEKLCADLKKCNVNEEKQDRQKEIEDLQVANQDLQVANQDLQVANQDLMEKDNDQRKIIKDLREENNVIKGQLQTHIEKCDSHISYIAELNQKINELQNQLSGKIIDSNVLTNDFEKLQERYDEMKASAEKDQEMHKEQLLSLKKDKADCEELIEKLQKEQEGNGPNNGSRAPTGLQRVKSSPNVLDQPQERYPHQSWNEHTSVIPRSVENQRQASTPRTSPSSPEYNAGLPAADRMTGARPNSARGSREKKPSTRDSRPTTAGTREPRRQPPSFTPSSYAQVKSPKNNYN